MLKHSSPRLREVNPSKRDSDQVERLAPAPKANANAAALRIDLTLCLQNDQIYALFSGGILAEAPDFLGQIVGLKRNNQQKT